MPLKNKTYVITIIENNGTINVNGFPQNLEKAIAILNAALKAVVIHFINKGEMPQSKATHKLQ